METELFNKVLPMNADTEGRIKGTVLVIIFHQLQFLNNSIRDTSKSCQLANTSAEVLDRFPYQRRFLVRRCKSNNIFLNCQIIRTKNDHENRPHDSYPDLLV